MKKLTALWMMIVMLGTLSVQAMGLETMRRNVRFLTDRMAYELQLTSQQYNDVYEVNFDFMYQIDHIMDDVLRGYDYALDNYYNFLDIRNDDLRWILSDSQYRRFMQISYFYRPVYTYRNSWNLGVFRVYTNLDFFYYNRPYHYLTYRGAHSRIHFANRSYYEMHHHDRYRGHQVFSGNFRIDRPQKAPAVRPNAPQPKNNPPRPNVRDNRGNGAAPMNNGIGNAKNNVRDNGKGNVRDMNSRSGFTRSNNSNVSRPNQGNVERKESGNSRSTQRPQANRSNNSRNDRAVGTRSQTSSKSNASNSKQEKPSAPSSHAGSASRHR